MLKNDREIKDSAAVEAALRQARICHLGLYDGQWPYVVPVNFGYEDGRLYFHSSARAEGKKLSILRQNDKVCFEVTVSADVVGGEKPCDWTTRYVSVIGYGRARILEGEEQKLRGLRVIMRAHGGPEENFRPQVLEKTAVVEITVESMTGKQLPAPGKD